MGEFSSIGSVGAVGAAARDAAAPTLDHLSRQAVATSYLDREIGESGQKMLALITEFQFDANLQEPLPGRNIDASEQIDGIVAELKGETVAPALGASDSLVPLLRDLYAATAKTMVAWKVIDGIGKDTKTMLQTQ